jgi:hypothetical protein
MADAQAGLIRVNRENDKLTHMPLGILNTQDEHEAKAPVFRGRKDFPSMKTRTVTKIVRERRTGRQIRSET